VEVEEGKQTTERGETCVRSLLEMGKDTQDIEWYRRWVKEVKEEFKQYNSGEATLTQLDATISQVPSTIKTVSCEGLVARDVEFGFGIRYGPYGKQAWMDPHQFITLPQVFCKWKMIYCLYLS
jgi:hypothetical protein